MTDSTVDKLVNPTAQQMISWLSQLPPDTPIRIEDPDTNWTISTIHCWTDNTGTAWFGGSYPEMTASF